MSEVQSRPSAPRGRGSHRAGRGGFSSRGGGRAGSWQMNGDSVEANSKISLDDQGELGQLKKQYSDQLKTLKELFPDWTDDDLIFACQEADGDLPNTIDRITEGNVSRFADVKKKTKEKGRSKGKDGAEVPSATTRGRGRGGLESSRGGRGRGTDRVRAAARAGRGVSAAAVNGSRSAVAAGSVPTTEAAWEPTSANATSGISWDQQDTSAADAPTIAADSVKSSLIPQGGLKKSWAMIAQPKPAPAFPKTSESPRVSESVTKPGEEASRTLPPDLAIAQMDASGSDLQVAVPIGADLAIQITPPKDQLTEDNLENLPDVSGPQSTETVASTRDPRSTVGTPYGGSSGTSHLPPISRPQMGGYPPNVWKNSGIAGRTASFQRKILEQQEAVVMPMNHAVDRTAVQFGSMGLNSDGEGNMLEGEEDREEPETRAQPPQQSPPSQPRASLPPMARQASAAMEATVPMGVKQAPGLPPVSVTPQQPTTQAPLGPQSMPQHTLQGNQVYGQYGRYGAGPHQEQTAPQKPQDSFTHQLQYSQSQEQQSVYPSHSQASSQPQQAQAHLAGLSSSSNDFPSQYSGDQQRSAYQSYYGNNYGQQGTAGQQEAAAPPQRAAGGLGASAGDSAYSNSQSQQYSSRFTEGNASGHTTPNPTAGPQQSMAPQSQQSQHMQQQHGQSGHGNYPYNNPYYGNSYYGAYMNQYPNQYGYNQQGYGGHYGGKGNMYGQPHHGYGMSPQTSYEHSASPANTSGFGSSSMHGRDSAFSGGLNEYGRSAPSQASQGQQHTSSSGPFGGNIPDSLGRSSSGFASQNQQYGQAGLGGSEDALKPFHDSRAGAGASPSGRPGSAANSASNNTGQSAFQPPHSQQQGFGGNPAHLNQAQNSQTPQYGNLGSLGGHQGSTQSHQGGSYTGYGGGGYSNTYGNYGGRGGWGGNYGH